MVVIGIAFHVARQDANKALPAYKGVHHCLEHLSGERIFRLALLDFPICRAGAYGNLEVRRGQILHDAIHQVLHPNILLGRTAEHRENLSGLNAFDKGCCYLHLGYFSALDIFFHQLIVEFCYSLNKLLAGFLYLALDILRQFCHNILMFVPIGHDLHMQGQQVCYTLEGCLFADRHLHRYNAITETHPQLIHYALEVCMLPVHLVHKERPGKLCLLSILPELLRLHLNARGSRNQDQSAVSSRQSTLHIPHKIRVARGLKKIQLEFSPFAGHQLGADSHAPLAFLGLIVQSTGALLDTAQSFHGSGIKETGIQQAGLACLAVAYHGNIPYVGALVHFHRIFLLLSPMYRCDSLICFIFSLFSDNSRDSSCSCIS